MQPIEFKSATVEAAPDVSQVVFAFFDGYPTPECVALLVCSVASATALWSKLGSQLDSLRPSE